jgi:hypothetical protein
MKSGSLLLILYYLQGLTTVVERQLIQNQAEAPGPPAISESRVPPIGVLLLFKKSNRRSLVQYISKAASEFDFAIDRSAQNDLGRVVDVGPLSVGFVRQIPSTTVSVSLSLKW